MVSHKKWVYSSLAATALILALQFVIFRIPAVYDLTLKTHLYDHGCWLKNKPKILILGNSSARYGIIPEVITQRNNLKSGDAVNLATEGAATFQMYNTYLKNINILSSTEIVYYILDPWVLSERQFLLTPYEKIYLSYRQWKYFNREEGVQNNYFFPVNLFKESIKRYCMDRSNNFGYAPLIHKNFDDFEEGEFERLYPSRELFAISDFEINYLKKLKDMVEKNGGKFVLVLTPKHEYWTEKYRDKIKEYDGELIQKLNEKIGDVTIIGTFYGDRYGLKYENFLDIFHLSDSGAKIFTNLEFGNIEKHKALEEKPLKHLYLY